MERATYADTNQSDFESATRSPWPTSANIAQNFTPFDTDEEGAHWIRATRGLA